MEKRSLKKLLSVVSIALFVIVIIWARAGIYAKDLPIMVSLFIVGVICGIASKKIEIEL